jgi:hypothetical protein
MKGEVVMSHPNVLVLAVYDTEAQADAAAHVLRNTHSQVKLGGVGVLAQDEKGNIKQHKIGPREGWKGLGIGVVLGVVAAIPTGGLSLIPAVAAGAAGGGIIGSLFSRGFDEVSKADADRIAAEVKAGHAVVGALTTPQDADEVMAVLAQQGGQTESHGISDDTVKQMTTAAQSTTPEQGAGESPTPQS